MGPLSSGPVGFFGNEPFHISAKGHEGMIFFEWLDYHFSFVSGEWGILAEDDPSVLSFLPVGIGCFGLSLQMQH